MTTNKVSAPLQKPDPYWNYPKLSWDTTVPPPKPGFTPTKMPVCGCCGVYGLSSWPTHASHETIKDDFKRTITNALVVLNGAQRKAWHDKLLALGFKVLREGLYNEVHESLLTIYLWEKHPDRSPDNPEFNEAFRILEDTSGYRYSTQRTKKSSETELQLKDYRGQE